MKPSRHRRPRLFATFCGIALGVLHPPVGYAYDDLALLSDEFEHGATIFGWQRIHQVEGWDADQLERWEINTIRTGAMTMVPHTSTWFQDWRGVLVFKAVTGDFIATTEVIPRNRSGDGAPGSQFSLSGILTRTPRPDVTGPASWTTGGENYVFLSLGSANTPGTYQFEVKTTIDSVSTLEISPGVSRAQIRVARLGSTFIMLLRPEGGDWIVHRRYDRPDMPATLQVGMTVYTDWPGASALTPITHNQTVIGGGNPDLVAQFEFFRYQRPQMPAELESLDLTNPSLVSDAELLDFLGFDSTPNQPSTPTRINHAGRPLPELPDFSGPLLFNTPQADAVMAAMQLFPRTHPWNENIAARTVRADSAAIIAQIQDDLLPSRQNLRPFFEMNYVIAPANQALVPIDFLLYGDESDPSPYPIPDNTPVEGWPRETGSLSLAQWQADINGTGGDRHAIIVQPSTRSVWETWQMHRSGTDWEASNGAHFDLHTNRLRPDGWTSGDAAGLSMLGGLVRYDECARGAVEHAIRLVVGATRMEYLYPATHYASASTLATRPAMGQRLRLRDDFSVPEAWTVHEKAIVHALKTYGAIVADNGNFFSISIAPDDRFPSDAFDHLTTIGISDFEVIETTGPDEGPRAVGSPFISAGPDRTALANVPFTFSGKLLDPGGDATVSWSQISGPAEVALPVGEIEDLTVAFDTPGTYLLRVEANDTIHSPAFDLVAITVLSTPPTPQPRFTWEADGSVFFEVDQPQCREGFTLEAESSDDLELWTPRAPDAVWALGDARERLRIGPLAPATPQFLRLRSATTAE